jgi:hypothetical protein
MAGTAMFLPKVAVLCPELLDLSGVPVDAIVTYG